MSMTTKQQPTLVEGIAYRTTYAVPVTLRQVEAAHIPLDSNMGTDEAEHTSLLDDEHILRLVFGVEVTDDLEVEEVIGIECYNATLRSLTPQWYPCMARYDHASGAIMRHEAQRCEALLRTLLRQILPDFQDTIDEARKPYDAYVEEQQ